MRLLLEFLAPITLRCQALLANGMTSLPHVYFGVQSRGTYLAESECCREVRRFCIAFPNGFLGCWMELQVHVKLPKSDRVMEG